MTEALEIGKKYLIGDMPIGAMFKSNSDGKAMTIVSKSKGNVSYSWTTKDGKSETRIRWGSLERELISLPEQNWPEYKGYEAVEHPAKGECFTCSKEFESDEMRYLDSNNRYYQICRDCIGKVAKRKFKSTEKAIPEIPIERTEDPETYGPAWFHEIMSNNRLTEEGHAVEVAPKKTETEIVEESVAETGSRILEINDKDLTIILKMLCPDLPDDFELKFKVPSYYDCKSKEFCGDYGSFRLSFDGEKFRVEGM